MKISITDTGLNRDNLHAEFSAGRPFPLLVVDNFLPESIANGVMDLTQSCCSHSCF